MKAFPSLPCTVLFAFVLAVSAPAQAPQAQPTPAVPAPQHHRHSHPAPTNLKVLPKNLTGEQVHDLMEQWEGSLGAPCSTCHTADPKNIGPNGKPRLNFADDSKPEKATARIMYKMTEQINSDYISMLDKPQAKVTCGTCHRGHVSPEPFVLPEEDGPHPAQPQSSASPSPSR